MADLTPGDTGKAVDVVIVSLTAVGLLALINNAAGAGTQKTPGLRIAIGLFASGFLLTGLAEVSPEIASGLAVLAVTTAAFVYGAPAWAALTRATSKK
jgi:hypothetical protein